MNTTAEHIMISIQAVTIVGCEDSILVSHRSVFKQNGDTACILKMKGTLVAQDLHLINLYIILFRAYMFKCPKDVDYCDHLVEQIPPTAVWGHIS